MSCLEGAALVFATVLLVAGFFCVGVAFGLWRADYRRRSR